MQVYDVVNFAQKWLQEAGYKLPENTKIVASDAKDKIRNLLHKVGMVDVSDDTGVVTANIVSKMKLFLSGYNLPSGNTITPADAKAKIKNLLHGVGMIDVSSDGGVQTSNMVTKVKKLLAGYELPVAATITIADTKEKIKNLLHTIGMVDVSSDTGVVTADIETEVKTLLQGRIVDEANLTAITDSNVTQQAQRWLADEGNNQWKSIELTDLLTMAKDRLSADRQDALASGSPATIHLDALASLVCYYAYMDDADNTNNTELASAHLNNYKEIAASLPSAWTSANITSMVENAIEMFKSNYHYLLNRADSTIPSHYQSALSQLTAYLILSRSPEPAQSLANRYYQSYQNTISQAQPAFTDTGLDSFLEMARKKIVADMPYFFQTDGVISVPSSVDNMNTLFEDAIVYYTAYLASSAVSNEATQFYSSYQQAQLNWPNWTETELTDIADHAIELFKTNHYHLLNATNNTIPSHYETVLAHLMAYLIASRVNTEAAQSTAGTYYQTYQNSISQAQAVFTDTGLDSLMEMSKKQIVTDAPHFFQADGDISAPATIGDMNSLFENAIVYHTAYLAASPVTEMGAQFYSGYGQAYLSWPTWNDDAELTSIAENATESFKSNYPSLVKSTDGTVPSQYESALAHLTAYSVLSRVQSEISQSAANNHYQMYQNMVSTAQPPFTDADLSSFMEMAKQQIVNDVPHLFHESGQIQVPETVENLNKLFENALVYYTAYLVSSGVTDMATGYFQAYQQAQIAWPKRVVTDEDYTVSVTLALKEILDKRPDLLLQTDGSLLDRSSFGIENLDETWLRPIAARVCHDTLLSFGKESNNMIEYFQSIWRAAA